jgi:hypothetical protein
VSVADWRARTAYEVALHTYDVVAGLGGSFPLSADLSASITRNPALWMLDRGRAQGASGNWRGRVEGSGR